MTKKFTLFALFSLVLCNALLAQFRPFHSLSKKDDPVFFKHAEKYLNHVSLQTVDVAAIRQRLFNAPPIEGQSILPPIPLEIPMPDGSTEIFDVTESPLLAPAIAKQFPAIKTYSGKGKKNKKTTISISLTSSGFNAIILNTDNGAVYIEKIQGDEQTNKYRSYYAKDAIVPWAKGVSRPQCAAGGIMGIDIPGKKNHIQNDGAGVAANIGIGNNSVGTQFRTFRLAVAVTGEFTQKHGGQTNAFNDIVAYINRVNAIYKNELSVGFTIVSGTNIVYTDYLTDPFSGTNTSTMLDENQPVCDNAIGNANYDLGMVVSATYPSNGNSSSGGGIAELQSLGKTGSKARNAMEEGDWSANGTSFSQTYTDQVFAHEIGHQFGMQHTFNSNLGSCKGNMTLDGAVEPGAGTTIMSYGYTCDNTDASKGPLGNDDYGPSGLPNGPILNFHAGSFALATQYMATIPSVGTSTATSNTPPMVTVPATVYTIPKSTPFSLMGSATDANNDALTYSWEGIDVGTTATPDPTVFTDASKPPFFRSYAPSATGQSRTYPILSAILDGTNTARGEKLPSVTFSTTHRLTVRDNNSSAGGVASADITVNVDGNIGPFLVYNDWQGTYTGNTTQTVIWSVNGTNTASPNVKISLSTDGGQTFPTVLAASVPNTGTANIMVPNVATSTSRIKVEAVGNIFFDISNQNFSITQSSASAPIVSGLVNTTACSGLAGISQNFSVTDSDVSSVSLVATSSNALLVPVENIVLGGTGSSRNITVTPATGQSGTAVITLTATNSTSLTGSGSFTLTVNAPVGMNSQPASVTISPGQNANFTVAATGDNLTYQWQLDSGSGFSNLTSDAIYSGVTTATVSVANATTALNGYQYRVLVSSRACSATSTAATLTVMPAIAPNPDLATIVYVSPALFYGPSSINVVVDVFELNSVSTTTPITVRISRNTELTLNFSQTATTVGNKSVDNNIWSLDDSNPSYYTLTTLPNQFITAGGKLALGLSGTIQGGLTSGVMAVSATTSLSAETNLSNNSDADKIEYRPK